MYFIWFFFKMQHINDKKNVYFVILVPFFCCNITILFLTNLKFAAMFALFFMTNEWPMVFSNYCLFHIRIFSVIIWEKYYLTSSCRWLVLEVVMLLCFNIIGWVVIC